MTERLDFHFSLSCIGEGNGNPLQCSCLENPRDGGAWWAAVCGVAQSRTRLKRLSSSCSSSTVFRCKHWLGDHGSSSRWEQCPWTRVIRSFPTLQLYHLGVPPGSHFFFCNQVPEKTRKQHLDEHNCCLVATSCLTLCDPMDCSPLGSSLHGISQPRILERVAVSFSRDRTHDSCTGRRILYCWATREAWWA